MPIQKMQVQIERITCKNLLTFIKKFCLFYNFAKSNEKLLGLQLYESFIYLFLVKTNKIFKISFASVTFRSQIL